ncbi:hypothetical protein [Nocardia tengchongensis]|uniref:hypothetical protein n=1 Tax=Nocardia tengchongensis TaxID=2055889 RepID=UPI0036D2ABDB
MIVGVALGPCTGNVIAYEAVREWITGLGFAELVPRRIEEFRSRGPNDGTVVLPRMKGTKCSR